MWVTVSHISRWHVQIRAKVNHQVYPMARGKAVSEAVQWIIIRLSAAMTVDEVAMYTDLSTRTIKKILASFRRTGDVNVANKARPQLHRSLCDYDIQVCYGYICLVCCLIGYHLSICTWC